MYYLDSLPNGIRVVAEAIPHVRSVSLGVWFAAGSSREDARTNGIAHCIEHLLFKGTTTRSARELAEAIDAVGGQLNAFTSKEYTCFHVKVLDNHLPLAVTLLSDMLLRSKFDPADIANEKTVIGEEIKMYEDAPDELVHDLLTQAVWPGHALGQPVLGSAANIRAWERDEILAFYREHYTPDNCLISVAGNIDPAAVRSLLAEAFADLGGQGSDPAILPPVFVPQQVIRARPTEQVHICLGVPGIGQLDEAAYTSFVLGDIMGGGASSHLFQTVREERGLAYSIYSYQNSYRDAGIMVVYAGMSPDAAPAVVEAILAEFRALRERGVTEAELARVKEQMKSGLLLGLENTNNRMSRMAKSVLLYGRVQTTEELVARIDRVTAEDVHQLAQRLFGGAALGVAAIGPVKACAPWIERLRDGAWKEDGV